LRPFPAPYIAIAPAAAILPERLVGPDIFLKS